MVKKIQGYPVLILRLSRYGLYRALPATQCKARYRPFNCGI